MRLAYKWQAALIAALGLFMAILDNTIVNVALPQMAASFHTSFQTITWVVTAYFLAQAAVIPITGYISDRIGSKAVFLSCLALFTLGSGLCAIAPNEHLLIAFRVLQGIGGGALFPLALAIVFRVFPPAERGLAGALIGVPVLLAPAFGPTIGGYLTTTFDWNAIFTVNVPIGIITVILGFFVLRGRAADESQASQGAGEPQRRQRFDVVGLLLSMVGFTALLYGISEAANYGWNDTPFDHFPIFGATLDMSVVRYLILGGVLLVLFVVNELRVSDPVMDVRLFTNYTFTMTNILLWAVSGLLFGSILLIPLFFETVQHLSPLSTGEILISQGVAAAVITPIAGRLYNRVGPRILATVGFILLTVGTIGFAKLDVTTTGASLQIWLILRGLGLGLTNIPLQTLVLSVVSNRAMARASSLVTVTRQVASAIGIAALTTFATQQATSQAKGLATTFQTTQLAQARAACIAHLGPNVSAVQSCVQQAGTQYVSTHATVVGINAAFLICLIGTGVCVLVALLVGRDPAVEAAKRAVAQGETVEPRPAMVGE
jgi:EmrB/QacA subfamily drug resistance transporter